jgi:thiamine biosynthesis lipoprotein
MHTKRRMRPLLGTFVEVGAQAVSNDLLMPAISAAFDAVERVQQRMSFHALDSELTRLNQSEGAWVALSRETLRVLRLARATMVASGGLFDPTLGGLLIKHGALPDHGGSTPLDRGLASDMHLARDAARLLRPVRLTLDGVAKGHAVDQAIQALRTQGVAGGWVNAGGDLRVFGVASLPVQQRMFDGQLRALGALRDAAVASSRTVRSQQAWAADQATFPGLVMAPEQQEVPDGVWTVLASTCWRADALTKVAALAPPAQREALVRRLGGMLLPQT